MKPAIVFVIAMLLTSISFAQEYTLIRAGEKSPITGYVLTSEALAQIVSQSEKDIATARLELQLEHNKEILKLKRDADILRVERDTARAEKRIIENIKNLELERLREMVKDNGPDLAPWLLSGLGGGIALSVLIAYAMLPIRTAE